MNDAVDRQTRTMRWILFWVFIVFFSVMVFGTLAMVFFGFGSPTEEERRFLVKVFIGEIGASVVALFWAMFRLRRVPIGGSPLSETPTPTTEKSVLPAPKLPSRDQAEVDFLKAFLTIFAPDTSPGDSYSSMIATHFSKIHEQLKRLEQEANWQDLISLRERLREYFEYSGRYRDGTIFGKVYVRALGHLGKPVDAVWAKIKDVGYMLVLAGEHKMAREVLNESLMALNDLKSEGVSGLDGCYFYCFRYLGISYHRDEEFGDMDRAKQYFKEAQAHVERLKAQPTEYKPLHARLIGNLGNLALSERRYTEALSCYRKSYKLFQELGDAEHMGIAELQIAQAMNTSGQGGRQARRHLQNARLRFIRIGWLEGQARVAEQSARCLDNLANQSSPEAAKEYMQLAIQAANESKKLFERVGIERHIGRVEELLERLRRSGNGDGA